MRRRLFLKVGTEGIKGKEAIAGDICLYNKTSENLLIVSKSKYDNSTYPSAKYSPVGVVVVPGTHDVYGDGSCAVISLKFLNYYSPDNGEDSGVSINYGSYGVDVNGIKNYSVVCYTGLAEPSNSIQGTTTEGHLPSDSLSGISNPYDTDTKYYSGAWECCPSPYLTNENRNTLYYQTSSPSSTTNAFSDFDGVGNTNKMVELSTYDTDWKTASYIESSGDYSNHFPAACCCWRYYTDGTSQGDWYLPAMGEIGYIVPKLKTIEASITTLKSSYSVGASLKSCPIASSTEVDTNNAFGISNTSDGSVCTITKNYNGGHIRPFLRVK